MKKILLCGFKYNSNFGDPIILDCCKYIVQQVIKENNKDVLIEEIDLEGKIDFDIKYKISKILKLFVKVTNKIFNLLKRIMQKFKIHSLFNFLDLISWYFTDEYIIFKKYYKTIVKNADMIVFVGGGIIKYKYQNCYHYINFITKIADKSNIPVCLNSAGVEGYDESNIKCRVLKRALNRKCIKMITTRDDIETLKKYLKYNTSTFNAKVSDPAVFVNEVYKIEKKPKNFVIGLGVCRGTLFVDNEINYGEDKLLNLWKQIIEKLDEKGIEWEIYTNGLQADNLFAKKLINYLHLDEKKFIEPKTPKELVEIISNFRAIVATRLHSNIIAYSLKVPAIGLVWNNKLKMFGKSIGYPDRFIEVFDFDADIIIERLESAIEDQYEKIKPEQYRENVRKALKKFIENNI